MSLLAESPRPSQRSMSEGPREYLRCSGPEDSQGGLSGEGNKGDVSLVFWAVERRGSRGRDEATG